MTVLQLLQSRLVKIFLMSLVLIGVWNQYVLGQSNADQEAKKIPDKIVKLNQIYQSNCVQPTYVQPLDTSDDSELISSDQIRSVTDHSRLSEFETVKRVYHQYQNCLFNNAVRQLENSANPLQLACLEPGIFQSIVDATQMIAVDPESGLTYGLADLVIEEFKRYNAYLDVLSDSINTDLPPDQAITFSGMQDALARRGQQIELDRAAAEKAFNTALFVFDEMRMAYPLHVKLQCLAKNLLEERTQLGRIRILSQCLPPKFINAATSSYNK